jgi:hypothetical protein
MLDFTVEDDLTAEAWESLPSRAQIPCDAEEFFEAQGAGAPLSHSRRQYHRYFLRDQAVLEHEGRRHAVYTTDVSRKGMGFLSPVQILPGDMVRVAIPECEVFTMKVRRCRRLTDSSYQVGAIFETGPASPKKFTELIAQRRRRQPRTGN